MLFGALDEMATNWILSRRRYSLEADADAVVDLFINGARTRGSMSHADSIGRRSSAPGRWARRSPRTVANAGVPVLLLDVTADAAREGLKRAQALKPDPFFTPDVAAPHHHRRLRHRPRAHCRRRLDHRSGRRAARRQARAARARRRRPQRRRHRQSSNTSGDSRSRRWPKAARDDFRRHWLGTHFFNPPRYLHLLEVIPTPETDPRRRANGVASSPITASARASSSRRTRRSSSRNHLGALRRDADARSRSSAASSRSRRSTR